MADANLTCVSGDCSGEYRHLGSEGDVHHFECQECGHELRQQLSEPLAEWAIALADGGRA